MIFRITRGTVPYTVVSNEILNDERLSFKAKGLLVFLLSKPDHWRPRAGHLAAVGPDGRHAIRSATKELEAAGYMHLSRIRASDGQLEGTQWEVYDRPQLVDILPDEPPRVQEPEPQARKAEGRVAETSDNNPLDSTESQQVLTDHVVAGWNEMAEANGLPKILKAEGKRLKALKARLKDKDWCALWEDALTAIAGCRFLLEPTGDSNWVANFDWFVREGTVGLILEGKYANREPKQHRTPADVLYDD